MRVHLRTQRFHLALREIFTVDGFLTLAVHIKQDASQRKNRRKGNGRNQEPVFLCRQRNGGFLPLRLCQQFFFLGFIFKLFFHRSLKCFLIVDGIAVADVPLVIVECIPVVTVSLVDTTQQLNGRF